MEQSLKDRMYHDARAKAQQQANEAAKAMPDYAKKGGCDWGLEWNALYKEYMMRRLPLPQNRFGHELRCEAVMPELNRF